jgi:hypothetical protein
VLAREGVEPRVLEGRVPVFRPSLFLPPLEVAWPHGPAEPVAIVIRRAPHSTCAYTCRLYQPVRLELWAYDQFVCILALEVLAVGAGYVGHSHDKPTA